MPGDRFTHLDDQGRAQMVDVTDKTETQRQATAMARIRMEPQTLAMIRDQRHPKGDVLATARIAGIQAAKKTWDLTPMCHPLLLTKVTVAIDEEGEDALLIRASCKLKGTTGVEMEALTAVSVAALTLFDMCKAIDPSMTIDGIRVLEKIGGKTGHWSSEK